MTWFDAKSRKYAEAARVAVRNRLAYPGDLVGELVTYGLFIFVFSRIWVAAFAGKAAIAGYDREMATWYFVFAELVFFATGRNFWTFARDIRDGQVAYALGRPYGFVLYQYAQSMGQACLRTVPFAALGYLIGGISAGPWMPASAEQALALFLAFFLAVSLQFLSQACIALTAFWVEENSAFYWIYSKLALIVGTLMPLEFLPEKLMSAALITPFPYLSYVPARIAVAFEGARSWALIGGQCAWIAALVLVSGAVFARGIRKTSIQGG
jgi:ABC-2 type transport system permease protein